MHADRMHDSETTQQGEGPRVRERGATAVEYALIVSLIAAVVTATVLLVGEDTLSNWDKIGW